MTISQHEVQRHPLWQDAILLAGRQPKTRPPSNRGFMVAAVAVGLVAVFVGAVYWVTK